jgi:hypothetical protein
VEASGVQRRWMARSTPQAGTSGDDRDFVVSLSFARVLEQRVKESKSAIKSEHMIAYAALFYPYKI